MSIRREKPSYSFTKPLPEGLPAAAPGKHDYYNDTKLRGLQLAVTDFGGKSFVLSRPDPVPAQPTHEPTRPAPTWLEGWNLWDWWPTRTPNT